MQRCKCGSILIIWCPLCDEIPQVFKWIKIKDRLPPAGIKILAYWDEKESNETGPFYIAELSEKKEWYICHDTYPNSSNYKEFNPTYWTVLILPPEE